VWCLSTGKTLPFISHLALSVCLFLESSLKVDGRQNVLNSMSLQKVVEIIMRDWDLLYVSSIPS